MQRFGFNLKTLFLAISLFTLLGCNPAGYQKHTAYSDEDMAPLTTLSRVVMDIVKSNYLETPAPTEISEDEIKTIVAARGKGLDALDHLSTYKIKMVSNGKKIAAIFWDPTNNRKLIEDLQCTSKVDLKAWNEELYGNDLTLNWGICR